MRIGVIQAAVCGAAMAMAAGAACAHPHIFIDAGVQALFDEQGKLAALRMVWVYDEFYSLLIMEDLGLDPDADGVLSKDEQGKLAGFDMNWEPGFAGDTYLFKGETPLDLAGPSHFGAEFRGGRIISTHLRALSARVDAGAVPLVVKVFDPTYYTAYSIAFDPVIKGRSGCAAQIYRPDMTDAAAELQAALSELGATQSIDELRLDSFPAVGEAYADEVRLTCAPPA